MKVSIVITSQSMQYIEITTFQYEILQNEYYLFGPKTYIHENFSSTFYTERFPSIVDRKQSEYSTLVLFTLFKLNFLTNDEN